MKEVFHGRLGEGGIGRKLVFTLYRISHMYLIKLILYCFRFSFFYIYIELKTYQVFNTTVCINLNGIFFFAVNSDYPPKSALTTLNNSTGNHHLTIPETSSSLSPQISPRSTVRFKLNYQISPRSMVRFKLHFQISPRSTVRFKLHYHHRLVPDLRYVSNYISPRSTVGFKLHFHFMNRIGEILPQISPRSMVHFKLHVHYIKRIGEQKFMFPEIHT